MMREYTIRARSEDVEALMRAYATDDVALLFQRLLAFERQRLRFQPPLEGRSLRLVTR